MIVRQRSWQLDQGWVPGSILPEDSSASLVLAFGGISPLSSGRAYADLRSFYPQADIVICSTAGEIMDTEVRDDSIVVTAIQPERFRVRAISSDFDIDGSQRSTGHQLAARLDADDLRLIFVISDGQSVNGSELAAGLREGLRRPIPVSGGLAGDGPRFQSTLVGLNEAPRKDKVVAIGFYGESLRIGHGSIGGWDPFGPERTVSKSDGNVLYELDGESALSLYKRYLGDRANELPGAALLFPLRLTMKGLEGSLVRTVLHIDEATQSMTFAGNVPAGAQVQLMKANLDRLIDAAEASATMSLAPLGSHPAELAILVSCVGRKLILGPRVEEEVEVARHVLGPQAAICGFYSYGELSPLGDNQGCELQNQTLTVTTFAEA